MEILPGVHLVDGVRGAKAYLLVDRTLAVIDTGFPGNADRFCRYIRKIGRKPEELTSILLTHRHLDHAGSAADLAQQTGARVLAHLAETRELNGKPHVVSTWSKRRAPMRLRMAAPAPVDGFLADGDVVPLLGGVRVIHTPGHTDGSVCYLLERERILFPGDMLLRDGLRIVRPLASPRTDVAAYEESLTRLAALDVEACCFAHGEPLRKGAGAEIRALVARSRSGPEWWRAVHGLPKIVRFSLGLARGS
ncbi:MAG: MBL fold metallo-hydrolase [Chloroflexota bacterium]